MGFTHKPKIRPPIMQLRSDFECFILTFYTKSIAGRTIRWMIDKLSLITISNLNPGPLYQRGFEADQN